MKMRKIGVLTFHRAINYGAILQTYALQQFLKKQNFETRVIDYRCHKVEKDYKTSLNTINIKKIISTLILFLKKTKFQNFVKKNIAISKPVYCKDDLRLISNEFDYLCVGSDQVWNERWTENDKRYFLDFTESTKKISYAASLGKGQLSNDEKFELKMLLEDFNKISVREHSSACLLKTFVDKKINVHLDPVFLLEKNDWEKVLKDVQDTNYVLVYMLVPSDNLMKKAIELAKKRNLKVILLNDNIRKKYDVIYKRVSSVEKFLGYFKNASYIVTNSFHGTAFSIVFEKNFFVELQTYKNAPNMRMVDLLDTFDLNDRIFDEFSNLYLYNSVNYKCVEEKKNKLIEEVKTYFCDLVD